MRNVILTILLFGIVAVLFAAYHVISFIKYKLFERKVLRYSENSFFVMSFGDKGLQEAFEAFLKKNEEEFSIDRLQGSRISRYFANLSNTDGHNKVDLFSSFIWMYALDYGKKSKDQERTDRKITFVLENMEFDERNGYKVISHRVISNFYESDRKTN